MDTEIVKQYPNSWSPDKAWSYGKRDRNLLEINVTDGLTAYEKIVLHNLDVYIKTKYEQFKVVHMWDEAGYGNVTEEILNDIYGVTVMEDGIQNKEMDLYRMPFANIRSKLINKIYNLTGNVNLDNILLGIIPALFFIMISFIYSLVKKNMVLLFLSSICICKFVLLMAGMAMSWPIYFGPVVLEGWLLITLALSTVSDSKSKNRMIDYI